MAKGVDDTWIRWWCEKWELATRDLSPLAYTAYHRFCMFCALHGEGEAVGYSLPSSRRVLMKATGMVAADFDLAWAEVKGHYPKLVTYVRGRWVQKRLEKENQWRLTKSRHASESARKRWHSVTEPSDANAMRTQCDGNANGMPLEKRRKRREDGRASKPLRGSPTPLQAAVREVKESLL